MYVAARGPTASPAGTARCFQIAPVFSWPVSAVLLGLPPAQMQCRKPHPELAGAGWGNSPWLVQSTYRPFGGSARGSRVHSPYKAILLYHPHPRVAGDNSQASRVSVPRRTAYGPSHDGAPVQCGAPSAPHPHVAGGSTRGSRVPGQLRAVAAHRPPASPSPAARCFQTAPARHLWHRA